VISPPLVLTVLSLSLAATITASRVLFADTYALVTPPSSLDVGCQGPCACPIVSTPTYGSFELIYTGSDPLFAHYDVQRYIASFNNGPGAVSIQGSGSYRIGGEVALVQQLTLDLEIQGQPLQHFDSGLVPVGAPFPALSVSCAVHGFDCLDSVLIVNAKPVGVAANSGTTLRVGLQSVWPNPFTTQARITFSLDRPGDVTLRIVDLSGRRVRELKAGAGSSSGLQSLIWDGRREDGHAAPAGVYWVQLLWPGGMDQRRVVKLE
jgi:hypothetical protein